MPISDQYKHRSVFHFTHIDNLEGILEHGLISTNEQERLGISHKSVSLSDIQGRRSAMPVTCGSGGVIHDYVPLYFCKRSSMLLYAVHNKIVDQQLIIYFEFPIELMNNNPCVFSDAAANTRLAPNFYSDPPDLEKLNWKAIDNLKWRMPNDELKQARMAELLIHNKIDATSISRIIVWNKSIKEFVQECYKDAGLEAPPIAFDLMHYFTNFYDNGKHSIVTGPYFINKNYQDTIQYILDNLGKASTPKFKKLSDLRDALNEDMDCIPETGELIDLESDNEMHSEDVGKHTLKVVETLKDLPEFEGMNKIDKLLVELGAYLHDIGKGPKSRWAHKGGRQQVDPDHPIKALPMVQRILTEDVGSMKPRSAKVICKLVCHHDLVGDIVGKGRRIEELEEIVEDERELDMIIAIGKADMISVEPIWRIIHDQDIVKVREAVISKLESSD